VARELLSIVLNAYVLKHSWFSEHSDPGDVGYRITYLVTAGAVLKE
jgi:hypothetical protein